MDGAGQRFTGLQLFERIRGGIPCPVFSVHGLALGHGVVGGQLINYTRLGADLAGITLRLLHGEPASSIPVRAAYADELAYDARELARWHIPESQLPKDADVRFREPSLWDRYQWYVTGAAAAGALQAGLIAVLLVERRRRARAQASLAERLRLEELIASVSAGFANLPLGRIGAQIEESLRRVGALIGVDRSTLWRFSEDGQQVVPAYAWRAEGAPPPQPSLTAADFPVHFGRMRQGEVVFFARLSDVPDDLHVDRATFQRLGVRSLVAVPIALGGVTIGVLTLTWLHRESAFGRELAHGVRALGEILSSALQRTEADAASQRAEIEARRALDELAHMNRVAAMGELASSLAHELNQPLSAILNNAQAARRLLARDAPDVTEAGDALADIVADDKRAGEVIQRMRALLKKGEALLERRDLNEIVRDVARLVRPDALLRGATIDLALAADLPAVRGDAVQLQQVALNLMSNALDAVSEPQQPPSSRRVIVRTARANGHVELSVEDMGRGVQGDDLDRIFEPFFTTKPEGLGMGLPICRSITKAHGGRLWAEHRAGGGTLMRCALPVFTAKEQA